MIIKDILLRESKKHRKFEFSDGVNLIYSKNNTAGKTTLFRAILHSIGYTLPDTRSIKLADCITTTTLESDGHTTRFIREGKTLFLNESKSNKTYILPGSEKDVLSKVYGINNNDILSNLLGVHFIDQDRGWSLLNRGRVIGRYNFDIDQLMLGLAGNYDETIYDQIHMIDSQLAKYRKILDTVELQKQLEEYQRRITGNSSLFDLQSKITELEIIRAPLIEEKRRIKSVLQKNKTFLKMIEELKIIVRSPDGKLIKVDQNSLHGFDDNREYLEAKLDILESEIMKISQQMSKVDQDLRSQTLHSGVESLIESLDAKVPFNLDMVALNRSIETLSNARSSLKIEGKKAIDNEGIEEEIRDLILKYANELGISEVLENKKNLVSTTNLKNYSGGEYQKIIVSYRLAYMDIIKRKLGVKPPLLIDSPYGKEIDSDNMSLIMNVLSKHFKDYQIFIASIKTDYDIEIGKSIEITYPLINQDTPKNTLY